jgi:hypothetical protein
MPFWQVIVKKIISIIGLTVYLRGRNIAYNK